MKVSLLGYLTSCWGSFVGGASRAFAPQCNPVLLETLFCNKQSQLQQSPTCSLNLLEWSKYSQIPPYTYVYTANQAYKLKFSLVENSPVPTQYMYLQYHVLICSLSLLHMYIYNVLSLLPPPPPMEHFACYTVLFLPYPPPPPPPLSILHATLCYSSPPPLSILFKEI